MPRYFVFYMQEVDIDTQHGVATECKQGNLKVNRPIRGENQVKQIEAGIKAAASRIRNVSLIGFSRLTPWWKFWE